MRSENRERPIFYIFNLLDSQSLKKKIFLMYDSSKAYD